MTVLNRTKDNNNNNHNYQEENYLKRRKLMRDLLVQREFSMPTQIY